MNPVEPPKRISGKAGRVVTNAFYGPVFMDEREKQIHLVRNVLIAGRYVVAYVNRLLSVATAKLGDVRNGGIIQCPKSVLVERLNAFRQAYLDAVCEEVILAQEVLLLDPIVQIGGVFLADRHGSGL